jgi:hypothetical protein
VAERNQPASAFEKAPDGKSKKRGKSLILPRIVKLKQGKLSEEEISKVGQRVIMMQKMRYGPMGCSKSINMEKVLLKKKINRKIKVEDQKTAFLDWLEEERETAHEVTPQIYVSQIRFFK